MDSASQKKGETEVAPIKQLAKEVITAWEESERPPHSFPSLHRVADVNESIVKNVGEQFELFGGAFKIEAVSSKPSFSVLHLQAFLWLRAGATKRNNFFNSEFFDEFEKQILKVASFGGDFEIPICGVKFSCRGVSCREYTLFRIDAQKSTRKFLVDAIYNPCSHREPFNKFIGGANQRLEMIFGILEKGKAANPFANSESHLFFAGWRNYLLSEKCSDVTIVCSDGTAYPAHQIVLSTTSPYFETYFSGPWSKQNGNQYETKIDSNILKCILSYMYTGRFDVSVGTLSIDMLCKILETGQEIQMDNLVGVCCKILEPRITIDNVTKIISVAGTVSAPAAASGSEANADDDPQANNNLWNRCIEFIGENTGKILFNSTNSDFSSLPTENPDLWQAVKEAAGSSFASRKRPHDEIEDDA